MRGVVTVAAMAACVVVSSVGCGGGASSEPSSEQAEAIDRLPEGVVLAVKAHLASPIGRRREGWRGIVDVPQTGVRIAEPDRADAAFYEVSLGDAGYLVVRADAPHAVVEFRDAGRGPAARLREERADVARIVRLDTGLYVGEDASHRRIARSARSVSLEAGREPGRTVRPKGWWDWFDPPAPPARTCHVPGAVPAYVQIGQGSGLNTSSCFSGCGPTAWAMVFGWASQRASVSPVDAAYAGLFRDASGTPIIAPGAQNADVDVLSWTLRNELSTFCLTDQGATPPWSMNDVAVGARAPGVVADVDWSTFLNTETRLRDEAVDALCDGRPVILGIGGVLTTDMHYPVASAYEDGWFWLNMGWGGGGDAWYLTDTWFMGTVRRE